MNEEMEKELRTIISDIKNDIRNTQFKAIQQVNSELILLYFRIGKSLYDNFVYGDKLIDNLSSELKITFPNAKGYSVRNLKYMKTFYHEYKDDSIVQQLVAQLPWGHNMLLIQKVKDKVTRKKYMEATIENGWSRNVLEFQIDTEYHNRVGKSMNNFNSSLPPKDSELVNNTLKDPYIFEFISLKEKYMEKELETAMVEKIKMTLLELGNGFSFVGNQYKITVGDEDYFIDLLFYHLKLRCYIVVELKNNKFKPEYAGKMNFYLSAIDDMLKDANGNPSIGIILCKDKNKFSVEYSLKDINKPIGISSYQLKKYLPTEEELNLCMKMNE